jgi:hypothetical protein
MEVTKMVDWSLFWAEYKTIIIIGAIIVGVIGFVQLKKRRAKKKQIVGVVQPVEAEGSGIATPSIERLEAEIMEKKVSDEGGVSTAINYLAMETARIKKDIARGRVVAEKELKETVKKKQELYELAEAAIKEYKLMHKKERFLELHIAGIVKNGTKE